MIFFQSFFILNCLQFIISSTFGFFFGGPFFSLCTFFLFLVDSGFGLGPGLCECIRCDASLGRGERECGCKCVDRLCLSLREDGECGGYLPSDDLCGETCERCEPCECKCDRDRERDRDDLFLLLSLREK